MSNTYYSNRDAWKERELSAGCGGLGFAGSYYDYEEPQKLSYRSEISSGPSQISTHQYLGHLGLSHESLASSEEFLPVSTGSFQRLEPTPEVS